MEADLLRDMHLFVAVAVAKNFTQAAVALDMPSSTLSRRIAGLEKSLGLRLLNRTTRRVELTEDGAAYLARAERIVEEARLAHEELRERTKKPRGHLRISLPLSLAEVVALHWLVEFARLYPEISMDVDTTPTRVDLIADNFDLCLRIGPLPNSGLTIRRLASFSLILFASPDYLKTYGVPSKPEDLVDHQCVRYTSNFVETWNLTDGAKTLPIGVSGRFCVDDPILGRHLALEGMAIAPSVYRPDDQDVTAGRLVRVLPAWRLAEMQLSAVTATRLLPAKTRLLLEFFAEKMRAPETPERWEVLNTQLLPGNSFPTERMSKIL